MVHRSCLEQCFDTIDYEQREELDCGPFEGANSNLNLFNELILIDDIVVVCLRRCKFYYRAAKIAIQDK